MEVIVPPLLVSLRVGERGHQPAFQWVATVTWGKLKADKVNWIYSFHSLFCMYHILLLQIKVRRGKAEADTFYTFRTGLLT